VVREDRSGEPTQREHSLDKLAKGLANGTLSRRQALKVVGGALLGGVLVSIPGLAWAQGRPCLSGEHLCPDGSCVPVGQACTPAGCPEGEVRVQGQCQCGTGPSCTGGNVCVNGVCQCGTGPACTGGNVCVNGVCDCPEDTHPCPGGTCTPLGVPCN